MERDREDATRVGMQSGAAPVEHGVPREAAQSQGLHNGSHQALNTAAYRVKKIK